MSKEIEVHALAPKFKVGDECLWSNGKFRDCWLFKKCVVIKVIAEDEHIFDGTNYYGWDNVYAVRHIETGKEYWSVVEMEMTQEVRIK